MNGGSSVLAAPHCLFLFADKGIEKFSMILTSCPTITFLMRVLKFK